MEDHHHSECCDLDSGNIIDIADNSQVLIHNTTPAYIKRCDLEFFRTATLVSSRRQGLYIIANISRKTLDQTGDGHFTPIGGYHTQSDKALLFDTARFKYPPHWVDLDLLF